MEIYVEELLKKAVDKTDLPLFKEVIRHNSNSLEDYEGKDFTVSMMKSGALLTRSFGITISQTSWEESRQRYPHIPQLHLPLSIKPDTIVSKITKLFSISNENDPAP
jgi:hypothetical protein